MILQFFQGALYGFACFCNKRSFADCNYYKIKIPHLEYFKKIIDENTLLINAYGEDSTPDYSISTTMLTYMEVENDIFQLNKYEYENL